MSPIESGPTLKRLREQSRLSQAELAHRVGVSQRHLSCIETSKAQPSRDMLVALLDALTPSLAERNRCFLACGYAPVYPSRPLTDTAMSNISQVIDLMLDKHAPYPAIVLDSAWNLVQANQGVVLLIDQLGLNPAPLLDKPNLLEWMIAPDGMLSKLLNPDDVIPQMVKRLQAESLHQQELHTLLCKIPSAWLQKAHGLPGVDSPTLVTRFRSTTGEELAFMTTITTFGTPLDITVESLRIELLYPVNAAARAAFVPAEAATPIRALSGGRP